MHLQGGRTLIGIVLLSVLVGSEALPFVDNSGVPDYASKAVSDAADGIVQRMGWNKDDLRISSVDMMDAKLGESVMYEFHIQIGDIVLPVIFKEEISTWRFLEDLEREYQREGEAGGEALKIWQPDLTQATLKPFQLAGPVDLLVEDAAKLRLAMPHDVDAGVLKRVLIADGAVVTVEGAREVSLTHPLKLPLPLTGGLGKSGLASSLLNLASRLRLASRSQGKPIAMKIVGPSTLVAVASDETDTIKASSKSGLKVKRVSPSSVELVSRNQIVSLETEVDSPLDLTASSLWPLASVNGSNPELIALEQALFSVLGAQANKQGSINLLKAKAAVASFVKIAFELEMNVTGKTSDLEDWLVWEKRPTVERFHFELLAKVEGDQVQVIKVAQLEEFSTAVTFSWGELTGNQTIGVFSPFWEPIRPLTLEFNWNDVGE